LTDRVLSFPERGLDGLGVALQFPARRELTTEVMTCFQRGLDKLQSAEPAEAVELLVRAVELAPQFPEARICLGLAYALSYNIYPAIDQLETAGKLEPDSFAAHYTLAKLNFKLRIPQKGYEAAQQALDCVTTMEQRKMLTELLREERARERHGIARPCFKQPFSRSLLWMAGSGLAAALIALLVHVS
jgi:tetratricopeptide (TPR) repeat protein